MKTSYLRGLSLNELIKLEKDLRTELRTADRSNVRAIENDLAFVQKTIQEVKGN